MFSFEEYATEVQRTTMLSWPVLRLRLKNEIEIMGKAWFVAEWVKSVLVEGFGFEFLDGEERTEGSLSFRPYNGPSGAGLSWTLGKMVLLASGDGTVDKPASIEEIAQYHDKDIGERMRLKAVYWEEMVWDYLSMIESLSRGEDDRKQPLEVLAKSAAATSWKLRTAADKKWQPDKKTADFDEKRLTELLEKAVKEIQAAISAITKEDKDKEGASKKAVEAVRAACGPSE